MNTNDTLIFYYEHTLTTQQINMCAFKDDASLFTPHHLHVVRTVLGSMIMADLTECCTTDKHEQLVFF